MFHPKHLLWPTPVKQRPPPTVPSGCLEDPDRYTKDMSGEDWIAWCGGSEDSDEDTDDVNSEDSMSEGGNSEVDYDEDDRREEFLAANPQVLPLITSADFLVTHLQPQSPLFRLPVEIRSQIWQLATATHSDPERLYDRRLNIWRPDNTGSRRVDRALLRTCRAAYAEAWDLPLKQTPLVIFDASEGDRPTYSMMYKAGTEIALFQLQAWQLLLLQRIEMTLRQEKIPDGMNSWIGLFENARSLAASIVRRLAQEKGSGVRQDVVDDILPLPVCNVVVRLNRRDWLTWETEPPPPSEEPDATTAPDDSGLHLSLSIPPGWTRTTGLFGPNFALTLLLETFGVKKTQLQRVVNQARKWRLEAPRGADDSGRKKMVWDGRVRDESWELERQEIFRWMKDEPWKEASKKVELMVVRYVLKDVSGERLGH
ncbi:hypothetical protein AK830_g7259 [Neonectria ditissima]|uniref:Uncharacterized protein n=1 Tax=Neonectria ditissima TaxID=78410 RepID=A0A0P7BAL9_9HYPO|nr:hypothetical protein AK830_g7259 [Neonectria ditissima]